MRAVPRERFVPPELAGKAHDDGPLPIGWGQTISQPLVVAEMIAAAAVRPGDRVLDFFAGSGTTGAVAAELGRHFLLVDRNPEAIEIMRRRLPPARR